MGLSGKEEKELTEYENKKTKGETLSDEDNKRYAALLAKKYGISPERIEQKIIKKQVITEIPEKIWETHHLVKTRGPRQPKPPEEITQPYEEYIEFLKYKSDIGKATAKELKLLKELLDLEKAERTRKAEIAKAERLRKLEEFETKKFEEQKDMLEKQYKAEIERWEAEKEVREKQFEIFKKEKEIEAEKLRVLAPQKERLSRVEAEKEKDTAPFLERQKIAEAEKATPEAMLAAEKAEMGARAAWEDVGHERRTMDLDRRIERAKQPMEETEKRYEERRERIFEPFKREEAALKFRKEEAEWPGKLEKTKGEIKKEKREYQKEYGGFFGASRAILGEKFDTAKTKIKQAPAAALTEGLGKLGTSIGKATKAKIASPIQNIFKSIEFSIITAIWFWITTSWFIPMIEGYAGYAIMPGWFVSTIGKTFWFIIVAGIAVTLPISIILGYLGGVDFKGMNTLMLTMLAAECAVLAANNWVFPYWQRVYPDQYAFMMCMVKYSGNMQICALNQTQQVQVQKIGSYQTLTLEMGIVTPSRTIPPMRPYPAGTSDSSPYYFTFTLTNKNEVGSLYEINVTDEGLGGIQVSASQSDPRVNEPASTYPYYPKNPIKPGGYVISQAKFNALPTPCEDYTYFYINITTDQSGGGSAKYGVIESGEGLDNQNFMYFFDPDVKTQPGPVDVYVYTIPFVLPADRVSDNEPFLPFIQIENKGGGIIESITIDFIYDSHILNISLQFSFYCTSRTCNVTFDQSGNPGNYILTLEGNIKSGESYTIYNSGGTLVDKDKIIGKSTGLISVVASYRYRQQFDEQIGCIVAVSSEQQTALCIKYDNPDDCNKDTNCKWCYHCEKDMPTTHPDYNYNKPTSERVNMNPEGCIGRSASCNYQCDYDPSKGKVAGECGAECRGGTTYNSDCNAWKILFEELICNGYCRCQQIMT